jgi:recombination protein RecR
MTNHRAWDQLIRALQCLPHVGPKSAHRMAYHLLTRERNAARHLAAMLTDALDTLGHCELCHSMSATPLCDLCADPQRRRDILCVVQSPMDLMAIEQTQQFTGLYFVLMGALSPIEGVGIHDIGADRLTHRLTQEVDHPITEIVLATNFNNEGETTAHVIAEIVRGLDITITRLAHGVPVGGELEYLDSGTIAQAFIARRQY